MCITKIHHDALVRYWWLRDDYCETMCGNPYTTLLGMEVCSSEFDFINFTPGRRIMEDLRLKSKD